jgi:hypothetical protein
MAVQGNRAAPGSAAPAVSNAGKRSDDSSAESPAQGDDRIIATITKNRRGEQIVVRRSTYNGHELVDVRIAFTSDDGAQIFTKKGVALRVEQVPELVAALNAAIAPA